MENNYKPGGGNKPQPYVPAGHGEKSGEYTNKALSPLPHKNGVKHCYIRDKKGACNFMHSAQVKRVSTCSSSQEGRSVPSHSRANSVIKKIVDGFVVTERFYDENGEAYIDIDYTCHGNPEKHPEVPHIHKWSKDENGNLCREAWESFK